MKKNELKGMVEYLQSIGEDENFRSNYSLRGLNLPRKIIIILLYYRKYKFLSKVIRAYCSLQEIFLKSKLLRVMK